MVAQLVYKCKLQNQTKDQGFIFPFIDIPGIGFFIVSIKKRKNLSLSCCSLFHPSKTSKVITIITVKKWVFNFCDNRPGSRNKVSEAITGEKWGGISTFFYNSLDIPQTVENSDLYHKLRQNYTLPLPSWKELYKCFSHKMIDDFFRRDWECRLHLDDYKITRRLPVITWQLFNVTLIRSGSFKVWVTFRKMSAPWPQIIFEHA